MRLSAQPHKPSGHAAIDATLFDRENASKYYCRRTNFRVQTLKTTVNVDTETQAILDILCTKRNATSHASAADKAYDWMELREKTPWGGRETTDQAPGVPAHRPRA